MWVFVYFFFHAYASFSVKLLNTFTGLTRVGMNSEKSDFCPDIKVKKWISLRSVLFFSPQESTFECIKISVKNKTKQKHLNWKDWDLSMKSNYFYSVCVFIYIYIYIYNIYIYIYIYIYCRSKKRIKIYFKIGRSTKRFVFFEFILFLHTCYICVCFQLVDFVRTYVAQGLVNGVLNETWTLVCSLNVFQLVGLGFI